MVRNIRLDHLSVCRSVGLSVCKVYCGKTADWIRMPFVGVSAEWGRSRDGCIRWGGDRRREAAVLGVNLGRPIVTMGDFDDISIWTILFWMHRPRTVMSR